MRVDMLTAHADDLGERIGQVFGVNVYTDPDAHTRLRERQDSIERIAHNKLHADVAVIEQVVVARASREFPLFDCMMAQSKTGDIVRLERRTDGLWNIISHEELSTFAVDEQEVFSIVKPLEVAQ